MLILCLGFCSIWQMDVPTFRRKELRPYYASKCAGGNVCKFYNHVKPEEGGCKFFRNASNTVHSHTEKVATDITA